VQSELHRIAAAYMRRERADHTLQPTALVNEAYLRLIDQQRVQWKDRAHFFGIAARVMRQVLIDYARKHGAEKRGRRGPADRSVPTLADPAQGPEIVELRYFGGLTEQEVAMVTHLSPATIRRDIATARFWLGHRMRGAR